MKNFFHIGVLIFTAFSCTPLLQTTTTTNIQNLATFEENAGIYYLPKTKLDIRVIAKKTRILPGPFNKYAKNLLGIDLTHNMSDVEWEIKSIEINPLTIPDTDHFYSVKNANSLIKNQLCQFSDKGLLFYTQACPTYGKLLEQRMVAAPSESAEIIFGTVQKSNEELEDYADSLFQSIPFPSTYLELNSLEEKAKEAARLIIKIRKRRFKLTSGSYEVYPQGESLEKAIEHLNKLEKDYLSLFVGIQYTENHERNYSLTPEANLDIKHYSIFRLDPQTGFQSVESNIGIPYILEIKKSGSVSPLAGLLLYGEAAAKENTIIYRLPDISKLRFFAGSKEVYSGETNIYQLGAILPITIQ